MLQRFGESWPDCEVKFAPCDLKQVEADGTFSGYASLFGEVDLGNDLVMPGADGFGNLQQSYLEEANVNAVTEISSLIAAQRAYETNSKVVTAADQMLSTTTQMFRS